MTLDSDFLVIGSGIAGLSAALKLAKLGEVHVVTKKEAADSNTNYAQGGIAAVMGAHDSFRSHMADTLKAGAGLCRRAVVRSVVSEGPARIRELIAAGVRFTEKERALDLGLEGGHSRRRILHAGDLTGREIERALAQACRQDPRIRIFEDHAAVDLILEDDPASTSPGRNRCWGAWVLDARTGEVKTFRAKAVLLATGGAGRVYLYTSNPDIATGAGMSMAYRAGARLANLEFVQFHPTCLYNPASRTEEDRRFLLSEALRGEGGVLLRKDGTRLMEDAHPLKDLAPRDIVARAIDAEMKRSGAECVFLDMRARPRVFLRKRFPNIFSHCLQAGFDMGRSPIPVVPAAHFFCGGVETGRDADTDIPGLHAVGETAHTGLHGANRLASNSLLEAVVFAHRVFERYRREDRWRRARPPRADAWRHPPPSPAQEAVLIRQDWGEIRRLMWNYVGIVRSDRRLESARERIRVIRQEVLAVYRGFPLSRDLVELRSIALLSELIIRSALRRKESRGLHYNLDHPRRSGAEKRDTFLSVREARR